MAYDLPKFESTLKNTQSSTPNLSFNPGMNVDTAPAQVALEKQRLQMQQNQQDQDTVLRTVKMASDLAQSFVEASKQRQQRDAVAAYAALQPNKALAPVLNAFPDETAQQAIQSNYPKTFQGMAVNALNNNQPVNPQLAPTAQSLQKPPKESLKTVDLVDPNTKKTMRYNENPDKSLTLLGEAPPKASGSGGETDDKLINTITNDVNKDPLYTKASQKATDIQGARDGIKQAIADPSTGVTALAGMEAVKSIVSQRFTQQEWEKTLPNTGVKNFAGAMEWLTNNPQDPKAAAFLNKLDGFMKVEQATQETAKQNRAKQILQSKDSLLKTRKNVGTNLYKSLNITHPEYNPTDTDALRASVRQKLGL